MNSGRINTCLRRTTFVFLVAVSLLLPAPNAYASQQPRDLIVVIDTSASMEEIFDKAKEEAKQFVQSAQVGDRITLITFGKSSHLLDRARITSPHSIGRILSEIDELQPIELNTNLPSAMESGLKQMEQFYAENPTGERVLMWLSDDKNNPPDDLPDLITFSSLKEKESPKLPDRNWFVFESPIKSEAVEQREWFVDWAQRHRVLLKAMTVTKSLGTSMFPQTEREFSVDFSPDSSGVWGTSFEVVAEVRDEERNFSATIPIKPATIVCDGSPWKQTFRVVLPERAGNYVCKVSFVLPSDKLLEVNPPQLVFDGKILPEPKPIDPKVIAAADRWLFEKSRAELKREFSDQIVEDATQYMYRGTLVFGPVVSGGAYKESANVMMSKEVPSESLYVRTSFKLPEGFELKPSIRKEEDRLVADVFLTVAAYVDPPGEGWEAKGTLSLLSTVQGVKISPSVIPVRMYSKSQRSGWGRPALNVNVDGTPKKVETTAADITNAIVSVVVTAGEALLVVLALWLVSYLARRYVFATTDLVGMLEIGRNPLGQKMKVRYFNLQRLARRKGKNRLTIGSSRKADIVLPHASVAEIHAKILTTKVDTSVMIFVQPLDGHPVKINEVVYTRQKEIRDQDRLVIGEFIFMYKRPETYRETIVSLANGKSLRGTLVSWDIDAPKFEFLPMGAPSLDAKMVIDFSALKTVSFIRKVKRFSRERFFGSRDSTGRPVEIFFKDGELLAGNMMGENGEWSKRFYVIPKDREDVALMLVERSAVQDIFAGETPKQSIFHIGRALRALTGRSN